jgi:hypothetical protein
MNHGKNISEEEQCVKVSNDRKRLLYLTVQVTAELNIHLEDPVSTKTVQ